MNTNDLTEKLKELLMGCNCGDVNNRPGFVANDECYTLRQSLCERIAQQLAPEIEKMMPRWIPVGERLPDEGQVVDVITGGNVRICDLVTIIRPDGGMQFEGDGFACYAKVDYWMPIPKGPMG